MYRGVKKQQITIILKYRSNFRMNLHGCPSNILKHNAAKNKIACKNFCFLFLVLDAAQKYNKKDGTLDQQIITKKLTYRARRPNLTYLRAPNRAKSSRVALNLARFNVTVKLCLTLNPKPGHTCATNTATYCTELTKQFKFHESNVTNLISSEVRIKDNYFIK